MPRPLTQTWLVSTVPETVVQSISALAEKYAVAVLSPAEVFLQNNIPDLIFLHFAAHSAAEYDLLLKLRAYAAASQLIILGDEPTPAQVIRAYDAGASNYVLLPLQLKDIVTKIRPVKSWQRWLDRLKFFFFRARIKAGHADEEAFVEELPAFQPTDLHVQFFGKFSVKDKDHQSLLLKSPRIQSLLACLLYHGHKGVRSDQLTRSFWPGVAEDSARNSLHVAISQLRTCLRTYFGERELILLENNHYRICSTLVISSDVQQFQRWISKQKNGQKPSAEEGLISDFLKGVEIYRGDFLTEYKFQEWTSVIRDRLWEHYLYALGTLVGYYLEQEQLQETVHFAKLLLQQDACHELTHRQLMYAYYRLGKRTNALQQYLACKSILQADLNVAPSTETEELYQIIVKQERRKISFPLI